MRKKVRYLLYNIIHLNINTVLQYDGQTACLQAAYTFFRFIFSKTVRKLYNRESYKIEKFS